MHRRKKSSGPFPSVFGPDTDESPIFVFASNLGDQIQDHETLSELLGFCINFTPGLPSIFAKLNFAVGACRQFLARSQERTISQRGDVSFENL